MRQFKKPDQKQHLITVPEVWHIWNHLIHRNQEFDKTNKLGHFAADDDFKLIITIGTRKLKTQIAQLEDILKSYNIPLPKNPPADSQTINELEILTDQYIFKVIFRGIQSVLTEHVQAFKESTSPSIRNLFKSFTIDEIDIYDKYLEYGKIKSWVEIVRL
ncbi:MAG: DUF3231 family protein [Peptococcaceae bacterium]